MKNWTIKEAVATIKAGIDAEAIKEIARINPLFVLAVVKDDVVAIANMMGEKFTVRRLDDGSVEVADDDTNDVVEEAVVEEAKGDDNYEEMSTKELMKLCDKRGIKVPHYGKNKKFYIDALTNVSNTTDEAVEADEADEEAETEETETPAPKKAAKKAADKKATKKAAVVEEADEEEAEEDDWGDEEEAEEEAPKAKAKKPVAKAGKKPVAKKAAKAEAEDEDDDWDL